MKEGYINWGHSEPQAIILEDLRKGLISLDDTVQSAERIWTVMYKDSPKFRDVCFEQFEEKLADHRKQVSSEQSRIGRASHAFEDYRRRYPHRTHNNHGRRMMWFDTETKALLFDDVKKNKHEGMPPALFHKTRPEYQQYTLDEFRPKIYQTIRTLRWYNWLELKRKENKEKNEKRWKKQGKQRAELKNIAKKNRSMGRAEGKKEAEEGPGPDSPKRARSGV